MKKADLITEIRERIALETNPPSGGDISRVLDALAEITTIQLAQGQPAILPGIGKLEPRVRSARAGRNPATGEALQIPAKTTAHFTAAKALKDTLNP